ncbi:MAG: NlpC/P60 family protein [Actinomycetota bacterium]|nr:NlpC/P60 family protein [Actinomycetota bacterium]
MSLPLLRPLFAVALIGALSVSMAGVGLATPTPSDTTALAAAPPTAAEAHGQVATLQRRIEQATERFDAAREELKASQAKLDDMRRRLEAQQARVQALQDQVDQIAAATYRDGGMSQINSVITGDPTQLLERLTIVEQVARGQRAQMAAFHQAQDALAAQQAAIVKEVAARAKREADLAAQKKAIEADLAKWQRLADAADQALRAEHAMRASRSAPRAARGPGSVAAPPLLTVPASGRGAAALRFAYAQLGKPYQWGASGPGSYDCSGLTMASWAAAGVSLPHSSRMQYASTAHISRSQLRPGDLVFFYSPISHVAIYVGGDSVIGAPTTGDVVRFQSISSMSYSGASRPG